MSRDINEYFNEHCDKMSCEECEMENDQKEEYVCYHQGFYVKGYEQGRADERNEVIDELKELLQIEYQKRNIDYSEMCVLDKVIKQLKEKK